MKKEEIKVGGRYWCEWGGCAERGRVVCQSENDTFIVHFFSNFRVILKADRFMAPMGPSLLQRLWAKLRGSKP